MNDGKSDEGRALGDGDAVVTVTGRPIEPGRPAAPADGGPDRTNWTYWAFISYSHRDERWARWLQRHLERYRVPRRVVGRPTRAGPAPRRFGRVFRDRDELASSPDLGASIADALRRSRFLVVVCSPRSAMSPYVNGSVKP